MPRTWSPAAVLGWVGVALLALVVVPGSHSWSGPVLMTLSESRGHGVHLSDLGVLALAALVLLRTAGGAPRRGLVTTAAGFHPNGWWARGSAQPTTSA